MERSTGETYRDKWIRLDARERCSWLRQRGLKIRATRQRVVIVDSTGAEIIGYSSQNGQRIAVEDSNRDSRP